MNHIWVHGRPRLPATHAAARAQARPREAMADFFEDPFDVKLGAGALAISGGAGLVAIEPRQQSPPPPQPPPPRRMALPQQVSLSHAVGALQLHCEVRYPGADPEYIAGLCDTLWHAEQPRGGGGAEHKEQAGAQDSLDLVVRGPSNGQRPTAPPPHSLTRPNLPLAGCMAQGFCRVALRVDDVVRRGEGGAGFVPSPLVGLDVEGSEEECPASSSSSAGWRPRGGRQPLSTRAQREAAMASFGSIVSSSARQEANLGVNSLVWSPLAELCWVESRSPTASDGTTAARSSMEVAVQHSCWVKGVMVVHVLLMCAACFNSATFFLGW
jgi:hypothetical protein